jgi:hypothetical protein
MNTEFVMVVLTDRIGPGYPSSRMWRRFNRFTGASHPVTWRQIPEGWRAHLQCESVKTRGTGPFTGGSESLINSAILTIVEMCIYSAGN